VPVYTQQLLDTWPHIPAYVLGRYSDVLAANALAGALHPSFTQGSNLLRTIFLDPDARDFYTDWDRVTRGYVTALRASATPVLDDSRFNELVGGLSLGGETAYGAVTTYAARPMPHASTIRSSVSSSPTTRPSPSTPQQTSSSSSTTPSPTPQPPKPSHCSPSIAASSPSGAEAAADQRVL